MIKPTIEECIKDVKSWMGPLPSRKEILHILRAVKDNRDTHDKDNPNPCDGCTK